MGDVILDLEALKAQFSYHLESLQNLDPENFTAMTNFLLDLGQKIQLLVSKPNKSQAEILHAEELVKEINKFIGQLSESQLLFRKKEWRGIQEQYEHLKAKADTGDAEAIRALKEFEPCYLHMREQMNEDSAIDFPSTSSLKFLTSHFKL